MKKLNNQNKNFIEMAEKFLNSTRTNEKINEIIYYFVLELNYIGIIRLMN